MNLSFFKIEKLKLIFNNILNKFFLKLGFIFNILELSKFEVELLKFKKLKKKKIISYSDQKKLFEKIKSPPGPIFLKEWEDIIIEWENCNPNVFKKLEKYYSVRAENLKEMEISELNIDFIDKAIFTGSFGMPFHFQVYHEAKNLGFHDAKTFSLVDKTIDQFPKKWSITNFSLFDYVNKFLTLIRDKKNIIKFKFLEKYLTIPISLAVPIKKKFLMVEIAKNVVNTEMYNRSINKPFLKLTDSDLTDARMLLKNLGIDQNKDWFVTLHARESGFHEKTKREFFRNGDINDYFLAIDYIIKAGGKVVRVGDNSMSKIEEKEGLIDYANSKFKSEKLDIILAAKSKFSLVTSSGFFSIACLFNTPVILTNTSHSIVYYRLKKHDMFVPSILRDENKNRNLKLAEMMFPPYSIVNVDVEGKYKEWGLTYIKNTPEDILYAVEEMINRLKENNFEKLGKLQSIAQNTINRKQGIYSTEKIYAHGIFPEKFLAKHQYLIS